MSDLDLLAKIIANRRLRIEAARRSVSLERIRQMADKRRAGLNRQSLSTALGREGINIIAEFKRRSPSKGVIRENADASAIARSYESAGAAAISVLTEADYFDGSLDDLRAVRAAVSVPIMRKDFIVDEYQVYESAAAGADALLLIVAALDDRALTRLLRLTEEVLGMDALVEVHTRVELDRATANGAKVIGVNNRDLRTFEVSTETSIELAHLVPADTVLVSESGLTPSAIPKLQIVGYKGFLVGEALMRAADPERELRNFRGEI
jgi:indole-3-glycerol phosphate synthase